MSIESISQVQVLDCIPNTWNPDRPVDEPFRASVLGRLLQGILLRPHPTQAGKFEIVCGKRRWTVYKEAQRETIACQVMYLTESEARMATMVENNPELRKDASPFQEAELLGAMQKLPDFSVKVAAAALGWEESRIRRRLRLLKLIPKWHKRFQPGGEQEGWNQAPAMMETIACYPDTQQAAFLDNYQIRNSTSLKHLESAISKTSFELRVAPFDINSVTLDPRAGACIACPKRSSAHTDLFGETAETTGDHDRCLDGPCYQRKLVADKKAKLAELKKKYGKEVRIISTEDHWNARGAENYLGTGSYHKVKESEPGALPAFIGHGKGVGGECFIKIGKASEKSEAHPKKTMKEKREQLEVRRWTLAAQGLISTLEERGEDPGKLTLTAVAALAVTFGVDSVMMVRKGLWEWMVDLNKKGTSAVLKALWKSVADQLETELHGAINSKDPEETVKRVAQVLGIKPDELKRAADAEIPEPKAWAAVPAGKANKSKAKPSKKAQTPKGAKEEPGVDDLDF